MYRLWAAEQCIWSQEEWTPFISGNSCVGFVFYLSTKMSILVITQIHIQLKYSASVSLCTYRIYLFWSNRDIQRSRTVTMVLWVLLFTQLQAAWKHIQTKINQSPHMHGLYITMLDLKDKLYQLINSPSWLEYSLKRHYFYMNNSTCVCHVKSVLCSDRPTWKCVNNCAVT